MIKSKEREHIDTMTHQREYKAHAPDSIEVDYQGRTISGYFATWDLDRVGDIIDEKAFVKTFRERGPRPDGGSKIKIDYNHNSIVGIPTELGYDRKGAYFQGRIDKTPRGDEVLERVRNKSLDVNSFQYDVIQYEIIHGENPQVIDGGYDVAPRRLLKELRVHFVGPVDAACNEAAVIMGLKAVVWDREQDLERLALLNALKGLNQQLRATPTFHDPYGLRDLARTIRNVS